MKKKILVADDEEDFLELIKHNLLLEGYEVVTASNGNEAMRKVYDESPNLLILDINMPEMDGMEVCKKIRGSFLYKHLPIIMLTVRKTRDDQVEGLNTGSDDYITKPFHARELIARVKTLFRRTSQQKS